MITTQSTTQSTTTKRRNSVHTNLFDPKLYQVPALPQGYNKVPNGAASSPISERFASHTENKVPAKASLFIPKKLRKHLPEVNARVTSLCGVWYVTSSISSNLSKAILSDFPYPVALTELQFFINAVLCVLFVSLANWLSSPTLKNSTAAKTLLTFPEGILPHYLNGNFRGCILNKFLSPCKLALTTTLPMGIFQLVGHISSYKATSLIPVSLVHSVKALSPIMTVCFYRLVKGKQYNTMTYLTLIPLVCGVIITCWSTHGHKKPTEATSETTFILGLFFALLSMGIFVSQNIFAKGILTVKKQRGILPSKAEKMPTTNEKEYSPLQSDKLTILFYCSCIGFILTLPIFISNGIINMSSETSVFKDFGFKTFLLVIIHGGTHFFQAMLAFQLIGMLSPVNYSIANIMKRIVIIAVALTWESHLSYRQIFGLSMTIVGLYGYDKWGLSRK